MHPIRGTESVEATPQSAHESFDARPGNQLGNFGLISLLITWSKLTLREKAIIAQ